MYKIQLILRFDFCTVTLFIFNFANKDQMKKKLLTNKILRTKLQRE